MILSTISVLAGLFHLAKAQSFLSAIAAYPQLSNFSSLLSANPDLATGLISFSASSPQTVLVPNNYAFLSYQEATGQGIAASPADFLQLFLQYHTLNGSYRSQDFTPSEGVTIPTLLTGEIYNNRSAGAALSSVGASAGERNGQVVFVSPQESGPAFVQSGLASRVNLSAIDGVWDGGRFHIIDGILTLPKVCTETIENRGLKSLSASLNRIGLADVLDHLSNVTCLGPTDQAFAAAGNPDLKLNVSDLTSAIMFHTIPQPLYSNFLQNGQSFTTANNATVRVTFMDGDIYFNDAKVLQANVLTNNGLIHVLDRIMSPLAADAPTTTATAATTIVASTASIMPSSTVLGNASATKTGLVQVTSASGDIRAQRPALSLIFLFSVVCGLMITTT